MRHLNSSTRTLVAITDQHTQNKRTGDEVIQQVKDCLCLLQTLLLQYEPTADWSALQSGKFMFQLLQVLGCNEQQTDEQPFLPNQLGVCVNVRVRTLWTR